MAAIVLFTETPNFSNIFFNLLCYHNAHMAKKPADRAFGKRLTKLRKERGLTMKELAGNVGTSLRAIHYYEKQSKQPPTHLLPKLSNELGVSIEELLGLKPVKSKPNAKDTALLKKLKKVKELPKRDQDALFHHLNALLAKNRKRKS